MISRFIKEATCTSTRGFDVPRLPVPYLGHSIAQYVKHTFFGRYQGVKDKDVSSPLGEMESHMVKTGSFHLDSLLSSTSIIRATVPNLGILTTSPRIGTAILGTDESHLEKFAATL